MTDSKPLLAALSLLSVALGVTTSASAASQEPAQSPTADSSRPPLLNKLKAPLTPNSGPTLTADKAPPTNQDTTQNKAKTADKAYNQMDQYIRQ